MLIRSRNRISITLSMVFIIPAIGILFNILYRTIDDYYFNLIGNKLTIYLSSLALINIYFFAKIIQKSQVGFPLSRQMTIFLIYAALLAVLFVIPDGVEFEYEGGIKGIEGYNSRSLDPLDLGVPVFSTAFFLYGIILSQTVVIVLIFNGVKQYKEIGKSSKFGKKYIMVLSGMILMDIVIVSSYLFNWLNKPIGRQISLYLGICIIPAAILLYLGLKQEKKEL
ncbi:MAG: hypothetical protein ACTSWC_13790 [Promethearchaeota archaeon]